MQADHAIIILNGCGDALSDDDCDDRALLLCCMGAQHIGNSYDSYRGQLSSMGINRRIHDSHEMCSGCP